MICYTATHTCRKLTSLVTVACHKGTFEIIRGHHTAALSMRATYKESFIINKVTSPLQFLADLGLDSMAIACSRAPGRCTCPGLHLRPHVAFAGLQSKRPTHVCHSDITGTKSGWQVAPPHATSSSPRTIMLPLFPYRFPFPEQLLRYHCEFTAAAADAGLSDVSAF